MNNNGLLWEEIIQPGASWSHVLKPGTALQLTDIRGGANVGALFYNFELPVERYNMPDTLKAQHIARLTAGNVLYSDMGRILVSITEDTAGWHDPIGGCSDEKLVTARYGETRYQECRNECHRNGRDSFLVELGKYGLGARDLVPNVNFFSKVVVEESGAMRYVPASSSPGSQVTLRAEMKVLVVLNTCPHPLDPGSAYDPRPVMASIVKAAPAAQDDICRISRPENARGFILTERYAR